MSETKNPIEAFPGLGSENGAENPFEQAVFPPPSTEGTPPPPRLFELGSGEGTGNPFAAADTQAPAKEEALNLFEVDASAEAATEAGDNDPGDEPDNELDVEAEPDESESADEEANSAADTVTGDADNPLLGQMEAQERQSISAKLPVFVYGAAKEEIQDTTQTFDALRISKAEEFTEMEDAAKVAWDVTYGGVKKYITTADAKKKKIGETKQEIERSKEFTDKLKKSKDKNPVCEIKPRVTGQNKGEAAMPPYKGVFTDVSAAERSGKAICIVPGSDGRVYEIRNEEMGRFITPAGETRGLSEITAGFIPALPPICGRQLMQIITFFRSFISEVGSYEAIANIYWDRELDSFVTVIPRQSVTKVCAISDLSEAPDADRYLHYMDIHSHNVMPAKFSRVDDEDERATRLYAVIGRLDRYLPDITVRLSNGGKHLIIDPALVFEPLYENYPAEWNDMAVIAAPGDSERRCDAA